MNYNERQAILSNWLTNIKKYDCVICYSLTIKDGYNPYLVFYNKGWDKWQELLIKYTHKQLSDYFIEVIRRDLPQLKGTRIYITNMNRNPVLFNLPKKMTNEFLYII